MTRKYKRTPNIPPPLVIYAGDKGGENIRLAIGLNSALLHALANGGLCEFSTREMAIDLPEITVQLIRDTELRQIIEQDDILPDHTKKFNWNRDSE
jgi:hypothetical protein